MCLQARQKLLFALLLSSKLGAVWSRAARGRMIQSCARELAQLSPWLLPRMARQEPAQGGHLSPGEEGAGAADLSAWMAVKGPACAQGPTGDSRDPGLLGNHAQLKHQGLLFLPFLPWQRWDGPADPPRLKICAGKVPQPSWDVGQVHIVLHRGNRGSCRQKTP